MRVNVSSLMAAAFRTEVFERALRYCLNLNDPTCSSDTQNESSQIFSTHCCLMKLRAIQKCIYIDIHIYIHIYIFIEREV